MLLGFVGSRIPPEHAAGHIVTALGTVYLAAIGSSAIFHEAVLSDPALAPWPLLVGLQAGLLLLFLIACREGDPRRWWLLGAGGGLWLIGSAATALASLVYWDIGELAWYSLWLVVCVGAMALSLIAFLSALGKRWQIRGQVPFPRVALALGAITIIVLCEVAKSQRPELAISALIKDTEEGYLRLDLAPATTVYAEVLGSHVRIAGSPDGLASAVPLALSKAGRDYIEFGNIELPVELQTLPQGCAGVKAALTVYGLVRSRWGSAYAGRSLRCDARLSFAWEGTDGTEWTYWTHSHDIDLDPSPRSFPAGDVATVRFAAFGPVAMEVLAEPGRRGGAEAGIAVVLSAGELELDRVERDGEIVEVNLLVQDSRGRTAVSERGTLGDFGYT
jgi:hypothetical protein